MTTYRAPLDDYAFLIEEVFGPQSLVDLPGLGEATPDTLRAVLAEGARVAETAVAPLNAVGDREGCRLVEGRVLMPSGFREAYDAYAGGGWIGIAMDPDHGGQGLPMVANAAMQEILTAANMSFATIPGLSQAAYGLIARLGDEETRRRVLPRLASGEWSGTMCLTEPHCGSDLGLIRTRAEPAGDQTHRLTGEKIFITGGDHDLTRCIVHLVLARAVGAPEGTAGLSLFLVPARDPETGAENGVHCTRIEEKLGLNASPTCALAFDGAIGQLLGEPGRGLAHMFVMMNAARLAVAAQGVAMAELAYQIAARYARERVQGHAPGRTAAPAEPADPILAQPDVRRLLLAARIAAEGGRAVVAELAVALDRERRHPDASERDSASDLVQLLTPVAKASFTAAGTRAADRCLQVLGGHGYIRGSGIEQALRDARVAEIYEGTNGIQALDLVARKLPSHGGRLLRRFFHPMREFLDEAQSATGRAPWWHGDLERTFARLQRATVELARLGEVDPARAAAVASDYLELFSLTVLGRAWARMDRAAEAGLQRGADGQRRRFLEAKRAAARFFFESALPDGSARFARIMAGGRAVTGFPDDAF